MILLTVTDLSITAILVIAMALSTMAMRLAVSQQLLIAAVRTAIQLSLIGMVLKVLFSSQNIGLLFAVAGIMLGVAGWEVHRRQQVRFKGFTSYRIGSIAMFVSSFGITIMALTIIVQPAPWYQPQYLIPLLGMMLGNTMTGIAIAMDRLLTDTKKQLSVIEQRLMLGNTAKQALNPLLKDAARAGLIPIINAMSAAGLVSLPGMMTGQILSGSDPIEAAKYQILIMFMIAAGTGFGVLMALYLCAKNLFDKRERLQIQRLN